MAVVAVVRSSSVQHVSGSSRGATCLSEAADSADSVVAVAVAAVIVGAAQGTKQQYCTTSPVIATQFENASRYSAPLTAQHLLVQVNVMMNMHG
eukprot:19462-Heterococcus_DN1.PRE.1